MAAFEQLLRIECILEALTEAVQLWPFLSTFFVVVVVDASTQKAVIVSMLTLSP